MAQIMAKQHTYTYRKRGKICWAKYLRFQPYEAFCGNTFAVHWPPCLPIAKNSWGNFRGTLKNCENRKSLAQ